MWQHWDVAVKVRAVVAVTKNISQSMNFRRIDAKRDEVGFDCRTSWRPIEIRVAQARTKVLLGVAG